MGKKDQEEMSPFMIQAVLVKSSVPLEEAKTHAEHILKKKNIKVRATKTMYRFRNLPKTKFEPKSYRSKKINPDITLVFGMLKPQFAHLKGSGMFDFLQKGYEKAKELYNVGKEKVKEAVKEVKSRGSTILTGTNYVGPFNSLDAEYVRTHPPKDIIDLGAKHHDETYSELAKQRDEGKLTTKQVNEKIRDSDEKFLENIRKNWKKNPWASALGYAGIRGKTLAEDYLGVDRNKFVAQGKRHQGLFTHPIDVTHFHGMNTGHGFKIPMRRNGGGKGKRLPYHFVAVPLHGGTGLILIRHPRGYMTGGGFFDDIWEGIKSVGNSIADVATSAYNSVKDAAVGVYNNVKDAVVGAYDSVVDTAKQGWNAISDTATGLWNDITSGGEVEADEIPPQDPVEGKEEGPKPSGIPEPKKDNPMPVAPPPPLVDALKKETGIDINNEYSAEKETPISSGTLAQRIVKPLNPVELQKLAGLTRPDALQRTLQRPVETATGDGKRKRGRPSKMMC